MKKIFIFLFSLFVLMPLTSGCTKIENTLTINNNKSAIIEASLLYKGDLSSNTDLRALTIMENLPNFLDKDYVVKTHFEKDKSLIKAHKKVKNLVYSDIDLSSLGFKTNLPSGRFIDVKRNFLITLYNIDMEYDYKNVHKRVKKVTKNKQVSAALKPEYLQKYADLDEMDIKIDKDKSEDFAANVDESVIDLLPKNNSEPAQKQPNTISSVFAIKLPAFSSYNNADQVEGTTYIWSTAQKGKKSIKLQYIVYSGFAFFVFIFIGILFFIYIARRIYKHDSLKRIGTNN